MRRLDAGRRAAWLLALAVIAGASGAAAQRVEPDASAVARPDAGTGANTDTDAGADTGANTDTGADTDTDADADADTDTDAGTDTDTDMVTDAGAAGGAGGPPAKRAAPSAPEIPERPTGPPTEAPPPPEGAPSPPSSWPSSGEPSGLWGRARELLPVLPHRDPSSVLWLVGLVAVAFALTSIVRRSRERLPARGALPRLLALAHTLLRLVALVGAVVVVVRLLPEGVGPTLTWVLLAAAAALGWSARDVLPDVVAGFVLAVERRVRRGVWVSGEGFSGTVEGRGLRATRLVDTRGHRVSVPNRRLVSAPIVSEGAVGAEHEVRLRIDSDAPASVIRRALTDAILLSPWVPPSGGPVVLRDPDEPDQWTVRTPLLEITHAARFEGELLERAEEVLRHERERQEPAEEE